MLLELYIESVRKTKSSFQRRYNTHSNQLRVGDGQPTSANRENNSHQTILECWQQTIGIIRILCYALVGDASNSFIRDKEKSVHEALASSGDGVALPIVHYCAVCRVPVKLQNRCSRCKSVYYCGKKHQQEDWKNGHKVNRHIQ